MIAIGSLPCDERGLFLVIWIHANLVVAGESIHKAEEFMAGCGIYNEVDSRQRETIFWACFIDVSEVDAESPLAVRFFEEYDVGQPFRIFHLSDYPFLEEFTDLLVDRFFPFWYEAPSLLLDWLEGWVDAESPLTVHFFDEYDVGQPFRIFHLSDCPCLEKFADLLVDHFLPFWHEAPSLLLDWLEE